MKRKLLLLAGTLAILTGCGSSNFYQLHPNIAENSTAVAHKRGMVIGLAEVEVADYLQKSELMTRMSAGRLQIHDKDVWAGPLAKNVQSVLRENLSNLLPGSIFLSYPWEEPIDDKYRIYVTIDRFDAYGTGDVVLKGRWSLVNKEQNSVRHSESINYSVQGGDTLDAMVTTQSRLLDKLSRRIAMKIRANL